MVKFVLASALALAAVGASAQDIRVANLRAGRTAGVDIGSQHMLDQTTALINKNDVVHSDNIVLTRSNVKMSKNDDISLETDEDEARVTPQDVVMLGTKDTLRQPTALINKNSVSSDNNVMISRSNIVFSQDDRVALAKKIEEEVVKTEDVSTATQNIMSAIGADQGSDKVVMSKVSAVIAAKSDKSALSRNIADLVATVSTSKLAATSEQYYPYRYGYRHRFYYPYGGGYYGWRYPLPYWNSYGRYYYPGSCGYGRAYGGYYYC
jgi:hypothetical protein